MKRQLSGNFDDLKTAIQHCCDDGTSRGLFRGCKDASGALAKYIKISGS